MHYYNATICFGLIRPSSDDTYVREPMHCLLIGCNSSYYFRFIFDVFPLHNFSFCSAAILYYAGVLVIVCSKCAFAYKRVR
jgi:hypothetical protein